jgi:hypothetical protein
MYEMSNAYQIKISEEAKKAIAKRQQEEEQSE